jgi:hypothetical protein
MSIALLVEAFDQLPDTDAQKCDDALARGDYWHASFYCPAGTFLGAMFGPDDEDDEDDYDDEEQP